MRITQAALVERKVGNRNCLLRLKINGRNFVVGTLSGENFPQLKLGLVCDKEYELSHDWENGSVSFCGYTLGRLRDAAIEEGDGDSDIPMEAAPNPADLSSKLVGEIPVLVVQICNKISDRRAKHRMKVISKLWKVALDDDDPQVCRIGKLISLLRQGQTAYEALDDDTDHVEPLLDLINDLPIAVMARTREELIEDLRLGGEIPLHPWVPDNDLWAPDNDIWLPYL